MIMKIVFPILARWLRWLECQPNLPNLRDEGIQGAVTNIGLLPRLPHRFSFSYHNNSTVYTLPTSEAQEILRGTQPIMHKVRFHTPASLRPMFSQVH